MRSVPIADGGEGTLESLFAAVGGETDRTVTEGPYHETVHAQILFTKKNEAVVEAAQCAGLPLAKDRLNPELTSTVGIGKLIEYAVDNGAKHIILALGGSCTNDCGAGMLTALGIKFLNRDAQTSRLQETTERRRGYTLADSRNNTARNKNIFYSHLITPSHLIF